MNIIMLNTTYEVSVNDRKYSISLPANAPMGEAYDVVFKFLSLISDNMAKTTQASERKQEEVVPQEPAIKTE